MADKTSHHKPLQARTGVFVLVRQMSWCVILPSQRNALER